MIAYVLRSSELRKTPASASCLLPMPVTPVPAEVVGKHYNSSSSSFCGNPWVAGHATGAVAVVATGGVGANGPDWVDDCIDRADNEELDCTRSNAPVVKGGPGIGIPVVVGWAVYCKPTAVCPDCVDWCCVIVDAG